MGPVELRCGLQKTFSFLMDVTAEVHHYSTVKLHQAHTWISSLGVNELNAQLGYVAETERHTRGPILDFADRTDNEDRLKLVLTTDFLTGTNFRHRKRYRLKRCPSPTSTLLESVRSSPLAWTNRRFSIILVHIL